MTNSNVADRNMTKTKSFHWVLVCIVSVMTIAAVDSAFAAEWKTVKPVTGGFTCEMPGEPKKFEPSAGAIKVTIYFLELPDAAYLVNSTEIPADAEKESDEQRLDSARDGAVTNSKGKLIEEKKITLDDKPGRQLVIEQPGGLYSQVRVFMVDNRLIQAAAVSMSKAPTEDMTRFFKSIKLTKE
jgi:hypothetical protein